MRPMSNGLCNYFTKDSESGLVFSTIHEAAEGPLHFFVTLANGDAVRVAVCEEHAAILEALHAPDQL